MKMKVDRYEFKFPLKHLMGSSFEYLLSGIYSQPYIVKNPLYNCQMIYYNIKLSNKYCWYYRVILL